MIRKEQIVPSRSYQKTVPISSVWDYTSTTTTGTFRVRVKGYDGANPSKKYDGYVYLVPEKGGAKNAHELPPELREMTVVRFWEFVDEDKLKCIGSPAES